ncbi:MAG: ABC transporter permease [Bacteroidia bacterium]|nr:ABC transporter permease [Bacteroidia bacterium]
MSVSRFLGFVVKEYRHIFRDRRSLAILFGMPVIQILLFGFAVTTEIRDVKIAVLDLSRDATSQLIIDRILASGYFQLETQLADPAEIGPLFQSSRVKAVLVFEEGFDARLGKGDQATIQAIIDATDPNVAQSLAGYLGAILQQYQVEQLSTGLPLQIAVQTRMRYNPELKGVYLSVPGLISIILMLISSMMTSISITREKEMGSIEILLVSPMRPLGIILSKVIPYMFFALINAGTILMIGRYVFDVPIAGSVPLLIAEALLFVMSALSLGILISTIAKTQQVALMLSLAGLMMPTILLSGFMFPIDNMPWVLQAVSYIIPARWFNIIVKSIMLKGSDFSDIWQETLILVGFIVVFIGLGVKRFKVRLD